MNGGLERESANIIKLTYAKMGSGFRYVCPKDSVSWRETGQDLNLSPDTMFNLIVSNPFQETAPMPDRQEECQGAQNIRMSGAVRGVPMKPQQHKRGELGTSEEAGECSKYDE